MTLVHFLMESGFTIIALFCGQFLEKIDKKESKMGNRLTKSSVLAGVLVASCLLGGHAVLAEETSSDPILSTEVLPSPVGETSVETEMEAVPDANSETKVSDENTETQATFAPQIVEVKTDEPSSEETGVVTEIQSETLEEVVATAGVETESARDSVVLNMVDAKASQETKELLDYLKEKAASPDILFGQQHALDEGVSLTSEGSRAGSTDSEVKNAVGDYPAIFGWDTLSLDGHEKPGVAGDPEQSLNNVIESMKTAHQLGGAVVLSMHPYNFVTGGNFNDSSGNVVSEILPGGTKNTEFNQWLDRIASLAEGLKDDEGKDIPLIFRPFHEQNGSWFWWGASTTKPDQYKALYRYTVEYLRDQKNIHNILYVYSPNTATPGDQERYLETYPGDAYVDILGIDSYDSKDNAGSEQFLSGLVKDLSMIVDLAEQKGKVAALTEFGYSAQGLNKTGNTLDWYSRIFNTIQSDQKASKIAYMLTWANFGMPNNIYVPYRDVNGSLGGDHELLPDFERFYQHTNTVFAKEVGQIYGKGKNIQTSPVTDSVYLIRPANGDIIGQQEVTIVVKPSQEDDAVSMTIGDQIYQLSKEGQYFTANITLPAELDNQVLIATIQYTSKGQETKQEQVKLFTRFTQNTESPLVVDTFEQYFGDNSLLHQAYSSNGDKIQISLSENQKQEGKYGMVYDYEVGDKGYAGRQISFEKNWQGANALSFWLKHSGYPQHLTVQIRIGNVSYEKNIALTEAFEGLVSLPLAEFLPAAWEGNQSARIDQVGLGKVSQFAFYLGGEKGTGTLYFDDIQAVTREDLPAIVDKYEPEVETYQPTIYHFDEEVGKWNGPDLKTVDGQLVASISGEKDQKTEINLQANQDLSNYNWYVVKLKTSSPVQAKLYIKVGDSWQWINNEMATVNDQWTDLRFDLSQIAERSNTREIGIEFLVQGSEDQVQIQIEQISLVKDLAELEEKGSKDSSEEAPSTENEPSSSVENEGHDKNQDTDPIEYVKPIKSATEHVLPNPSGHVVETGKKPGQPTALTAQTSSKSSKTLPQTGDGSSLSFMLLGLGLLSAVQIFKHKKM
ncbi:LPXTG cell wall anchor domain-containing protein [Streptococcus suis]|nr:LPXTG cell wall anchor domain-containing protein [Streptococcus suis]